MCWELNNLNLCDILLWQASMISCFWTGLLRRSLRMGVLFGCLLSLRILLSFAEVDLPSFLPAALIIAVLFPDWPRFSLENCFYLLRGVLEQGDMWHTPCHAVCAGLLWHYLNLQEQQTVRCSIRPHHGTPGFLWAFGMSFFMERLPEAWSVEKCCGGNTGVLCMPIVRRE